MTRLLYLVRFGGKRESIAEVILVTLVQEAMSIIETMPRRNQQIVLDLLRAMNSQSAFNERPVKNVDTKMRAAVMDLAGLWKDHDNILTVEESVRDMRKGRSFDT